MAVVTCVHFMDLPTASASFLGKRFEERPRRVSLRNAADEGCRNMSLVVLLKTKRLLKAAQTEVTQPLAYKVSRFSWLESPKIELAFSAR